MVTFNRLLHTSEKQLVPFVEKYWVAIRNNRIGSKTLYQLFVETQEVEINVSVTANLGKSGPFSEILNQYANAATINPLQADQSCNIAWHIPSFPSRDQSNATFFVLG